MKKHSIGTILVCSLAAFLGSCAACAAQSPEKVDKLIECAQGTIRIEAEVLDNGEEVCSGTLKPRLFEMQQITRLYGEEQHWQKESDLKAMQGESWGYQFPVSETEGGVTGAITYGGTGMTFGIKGVERNPQILDEACKLPPDEVLELLGIDAETREWETSVAKNYAVWGLICGRKAAFFSPMPYRGTMCYENGSVTSVWFETNYEVEQSQAVEIISVDEAVKELQRYADLMMVNPVPSGNAITEIELQYYLEEAEGAVTFRPVWVFSVEDIWGNDKSFMGSMVDFAYIDAQAGTLAVYRGQ